MMAIPERRRAKFADVGAFVGELYGVDLHAKRVESLAGATLGVMQSASLAVAVIGQALAQARGLVTKHAIKQVDRMLSNTGIDAWDSFARWVPHQIGERRGRPGGDGLDRFRPRRPSHARAEHMVTGHGRAAPLLWLSVWKDELKKQRNDFEDACLRRLAALVPSGCRVTILADRGFGDQKLFAFLAELGFGYVIRFRGNIQVADADGTTKPAADWVGKGGRAGKLMDARVTAKNSRRRIATGMPPRPATSIAAISGPSSAMSNPDAELIRLCNRPVVNRALEEAAYKANPNDDQ